jgi:hypothetical protein
MANYWAVGAHVSGQDMSEDFITRGFWFGDRDGRAASIRAAALSSVASELFAGNTGPLPSLPGVTQSARPA